MSGSHGDSTVSSPHRDGKGYSQEPFTHFDAFRLHFREFGHDGEQDVIVCNRR